MGKIIKSFTLFALFLTIANTGTVWAEQTLPGLTLGSGPADDLSMATEPGRLESSGIYFEVKNSEWLNVSLTSSELIKLSLESVPEMITMHIETSAGAFSTLITIGGLAPKTTYHKYEDNYHNHEVFTTDDNGSYTYKQDLSVRHTVFVQTRKSTKFIRDDATGGDCYAVGIWDSPTKTCTLTTDLNETIQIDSDNIILDGNNHTLTGWNTGNGILVYEKAGVTIKKMKISQFTNGIAYYGLRWNPKGNTFTDNSLTQNIKGIYLEFAGNNILTNNILSNNSYGISLYYNSNNNTIANNTVSNNSSYGISLDYQSNSNNVSGNTVSNNNNGIVVSWFSGGNTVTGNTADSNSSSGILVSYSRENTLSENIASNNLYGILLSGWNSFWNVVKNNTMTSNRSSNQSAGGLKSGVGLLILGTDTGNDVFNNNFINNSVQAYCTYTVCSFNHSAPEGGNYWSNYDTPAEGCNDTNGDSFCDSPYVPYYFGQAKDNLPWTKRDGWKPDSVTPTTLISLSGTVGSNGWYVSGVEVILAATDNAGGSGVAKTEYSFDGTNWIAYTAPVIINTEGTISVTYRSIDSTGNVEAANTQIINIDKVFPVITATVTPDANLSDWHNTDVTVTFTCTDSTSGVAQCPSPLTIRSEGAGQVVSGTAIDKAGNSGTASVTLNIDKTPPSIIGAATTSPNANGWYRADVVVHFTASDNMSGINTVTPDITILAEGANQSVAGTGYDKAGNSASRIVSGINIDKTAPIITITSPVAAQYDQSVTINISFTASDIVSGVYETTVYLDGQQYDPAIPIDPLYLSLGTHTLKVESENYAGLIATQSVDFNIIATTGSLSTMITRFFEMGAIDNAGIATSLTQKLDAGQLEAFINMLDAQSGKHISTFAAEILKADALYLISKL